jgi:hypothetical protein
MIDREPIVVTSKLTGASLQTQVRWALRPDVEEIDNGLFYDLIMSYRTVIPKLFVVLENLVCWHAGGFRQTSVGWSISALHFSLDTGR